MSTGISALASGFLYISLPSLKTATAFFFLLLTFNTLDFNFRKKIKFDKV